MNLKPDMAKLKALAVKIKGPLINSAAGAMVGGVVGSAAGYHVGKKRGTKRTAIVLSKEFGRFNQMENQQLAQRAYIAGLQDAGAMGKTSSLNKTDYLESIKIAAFNDEIEKSAAMSGASAAHALKRMVRNVADTYKESWRATANLKNEMRDYIRALRSKAPHGNYTVSQTRQSLLRTAKKSTPLLATAGVGAAGTAYATIRGKKNSNERGS